MTILFIKSEIMNFLPTNISNFFPNLETLEAGRKIQKIFRSNFEKLFKLKNNILDQNEIEFIDDDEIFQDNPSLLWISLKENKIKKISGNIFVNLANLKRINLNGNDCSLNDFYRNDRKSGTNNLEIAEFICGAKLPENFAYL